MRDSGVKGDSLRLPRVRSQLQRETEYAPTTEYRSCFFKCPAVTTLHDSVRTFTAQKGAINRWNSDTNVDCKTVCGDLIMIQSELDNQILRENPYGLCDADSG